MKHLSFYILSLILIGNSFNIYANIFPSYSNINTNSIQPYFLSTEVAEDVPLDTRRIGLDVSLFSNSMVMISAFREAGMPKEMIQEQIDMLLNNIDGWNDRLNFIAKRDLDSTYVYRVYNEISDSETFVVLFVDSFNDSVEVYPLDSYYTQDIYDYSSLFINGGIDGFLTTISDGWQAQEVRIGDVDGDGMVDAFLAMGDPICTNQGTITNANVTAGVDDIVVVANPDVTITVKGVNLASAGKLMNPGIHQYYSYRYNTNVINPLYNSQTEVPVVSNQDRTAMGQNSFNDVTAMLNDARENNDSEFVLMACDYLISQLPDWNTKLNFVRSTHPDRTEVYRINHGGVQVDIKVQYTTSERFEFEVFPLDNGYQGLFDNNTQYFTSFDDLWATIAPGVVVERVFIGDYNDDELIDAFLLSNGEGNVYPRSSANANVSADEEDKIALYNPDVTVYFDLSFDFPKYEYAIDQIIPLYLSSEATNIQTNFNRQYHDESMAFKELIDSVMIAIQDNDVYSYHIFIERLHNFITSYDKMLSAICVNLPEKTKVYSLEISLTTVKHYFLIYNKGRSSYVIPLDSNYISLYSINNSKFRSVDSFFEGITQECVITEILFGDVDGDLMLDLFYLVNSEPVLVVEN